MIPMIQSSINWLIIFYLTVLDLLNLKTKEIYIYQKVYAIGDLHPVMGGWY